jgi:trimeric autotransporter adhesin
MQFTATGHYQNGSTADVTDGVLWSTDSPEIALISVPGTSTGLAIGVGPGTANVTADAGSITSFESITVAP